jgi:hypothetical protein
MAGEGLRQADNRLGKISRTSLPSELAAALKDCEVPMEEALGNVLVRLLSMLGDVIRRMEMDREMEAAAAAAARELAGPASTVSSVSTEVEEWEGREDDQDLKPGAEWDMHALDQDERGETESRPSEKSLASAMDALILRQGGLTFMTCGDAFCGLGIRRLTARSLSSAGEPDPLDPSIEALRQLEEVWSALEGQLHKTSDRLRGEINEQNAYKKVSVFSSLSSLLLPCPSHNGIPFGLDRW